MKILYYIVILNFLGMIYGLNSFNFYIEDLLESNHISRVIRSINKYINEDFINYGEKLLFSEETRVFDQREEVNYINTQIKKFIIDIPEVDIILGISDPVPQPGMDGRIRTYRYEVATNIGPIGIYLKWAEEDIEAERFEKASNLGIAPRSFYIPLGYIISEEAPGIKLSDLLYYDGHTEWISEEKNYRLLFQELGKIIAKLEKNDIYYSDWLVENTFVEIFEDKINIKIIDYEDSRLTGYDESIRENIMAFIRDITTPLEQIQKIIGNLTIEIEAKEDMLKIFKQAYEEEIKR